ncbi:MAG: 4Fe-4S double cluster binding domain-containing protein [Christensenella sp.]|uniref:4Fe-4S double cluster binding domain-containing protein n=1 Tax=Christensenella sp. TaxID=1935934 RepID=UPI002B1FB634|nr:4Fe-4S double cluster binding domain-containing protein [Christensenella sp.]MEA5001988.1 4Fe-4S double cluster binding domain-containing protein [Christensenella sp.]
MEYEKILDERFVDLYGSTLLPEELCVLDGLCYAISFAVSLPNAVIDGITNGPTKTYFHHYRTCNSFLDQTAFLLVQAIRREGYDAAYIPASQSVSDDGYRGLLPHKAVARLCGLGGIGDNDLFLTPEYGCRVRLCTVLTDMPVAHNVPSQNPCTHCGLCTRACPSGALCGREWSEGISVQDMIDVGKCSMHMKKSYQKIGRGAVCGICMAVCPVGTRKEMKTL